MNTPECMSWLDDDDWNPERTRKQRINVGRVRRLSIEEARGLLETLNDSDPNRVGDLLDGLDADQSGGAL